MSKYGSVMTTVSMHPKASSKSNQIRDGPNENNPQNINKEGLYQRVKYIGLIKTDLKVS